MNKLAQINLFPEGGFKGFGPLGLEDGQEGIPVFATFISSAVGLITLIGVIWFIFIIVTGAIGIISSGGDKSAMETAKKKITSGVIGLVVIIAALFILDLIGTLLGVPDLLNFTEMFGKIAPITQ